MVKFTLWDKDHIYNRELTKFTRELNTYGFDKNGFGEELLFPIRLNEPSGGNQETNLATYLVKFLEFEKSSVKIKNIDDKEWFNCLNWQFNLNFSIFLNFYFFSHKIFFTTFKFNFLNFSFIKIKPILD